VHVGQDALEQRALPRRDARAIGHAIAAASLQFARELAQGAREPLFGALCELSPLALERIGTRRDAIGLKIVERLNGLLREGLPPQTRARLLAEGAALTPAEAIARALDAGTPASDRS